MDEVKRPKGIKARVIISIFAISLVNGLQHVLSPVLSSVRDHYPDISVSMIQMLVTMPMLIAIVFALLTGWIALYISKKKIFLFAAAVSGITGLMPLLSDSFGLLLAARALYGIALGIVISLVTALVADFFDGEERIQVMGVQGASVGAGLMLVTALAGFVGRSDFHYVFYISILGFVAFAVMLFLLPDKPVHREQTGTKKKIRLNRKVWILAAFLFAEGFFIIMFTTNVAMHLAGPLKGDTVAAGTITSVFSAAQIVMGLLLRRITAITKKFTLPVEEMPKELIREIVAAYGKGAALVKDCGFDMVMFHAAHGWLFSQFLSPVMNRRTDEYGGSFENRCRFMLEALQAVRDAVGPRFPIEIRLSGNDLTSSGLDMDQCVKVAEMVDDKVDLINVSCGNHEDPDMFCRTHPSSFFERGVNVVFAAEIKKHVKTPVSCVGSLIDPDQMEEIIASGRADCVEIGRGELADPYIAAKALAGKADDITPCLRCYECFAETGKSETLKCTVNPVTGQELDQKEIRPAQSARKVLIAGGGPAGMEAAIVCAARGHDVTLAEKAGKLGGNLHPAGAAWFKKDIERLCKVLTKRVENSNVKVLLDTEVTPDFVRENDPDVLIVAIGSNELKPPIPGIDGDNVLMAIDAELHPEKLGKKVVIMGGGLVGSEAAIGFHDEGHEVAIVEMKSAVAEEVNSFYRGGLMPEIERSAQVYTDTKVKEITSRGVLCERNGEEILIEGDTVVCALGFRAPYDVVDSLCEAAEVSEVIGDCSNVGKIYQATLTS